MTSREIVVDASVALEWLLGDARGEADVPAANRLLLGVRDGEVRLVQPQHFLLEIAAVLAAVLARMSPVRAARDLAELRLVEMSILGDEEIVQQALGLAIRHRQHVFDTLYHAVALSRPEAMLVTADERYWRAARHEGRVVRLADFAMLH